MTDCGLVTVVPVSAVRFSPAGSRVRVKRRARTSETRTKTYKTYKTDCWTFWLAGFDASVDHMKLGDLQASSVLKHEIRRAALARPGSRVKTVAVTVRVAALPFRRQVMVQRRALTDFAAQHQACDPQDCIEFGAWACGRGASAADLAAATDEDILEFAARKRALAEQAEARGLRVCPTDPLALEPAMKPSTSSAQCSAKKSPCHQIELIGYACLQLLLSLFWIWL